MKLKTTASRTLAGFADKSNLISLCVQHNMARCVAITLLLLTAYADAFSQTQPKFPENYQQVVKLPLLSQLPPYRTDMPLDVLIGYIALDSLAKSMSIGEYVRRRDNLPAYDDTVKQALKYHYLMKDYDPVTFFQWMESSQKGHFIPDRMTTKRIEMDIFNTYLHALPSEKVLCTKLYLLLNSDMIAHVKVNSTSMKYDSLANIAKHELMATSEIIEPIKGKVVPSCVSSSEIPQQSLTSPVTLPYLHRADSGTCVQWAYRLEHWNRFNIDTTLANQWVQPNKEYIVFFDYTPLEDELNVDSLGLYFEVSPYPAAGKGRGMYPIVDGKVLHSAEDFGTATDMTVAEFKAMLREQIYNITHP